MPKQCMHPGCDRNQWGGGYCQWHQYKRGPKKKIRFYSKKRQVVNRSYNAEAKAFCEEHPECQIKSPVCIGITQGVHHVKGRGKYLRDKKKWMGACNPCNEYVESHDAWARENGFKESKFTNQ